MPETKRLLGKLGVWSAELRDAGHPRVQEAAAELDAQGLRALWIPGLDGSGALDDVRHLLVAAPRATVALGVLGIWGQDPEEVAKRLHAMNEDFGSRAIVGLGVSNQGAAARAGQVYGDPVAAMSTYLDRLDSADQPVRIGQRLLGALGPRMAALAASRTAGLHPFLVPPEHTVAVRAALGPVPLIAPHQAVVFDADPARARAVARRAIGAFFGFPAYRRNLSKLGFTDSDLAPGGSDRLVDAVVAHGTAEDIRARIQTQLDAGADHVAVHVVTAAGSPGLPMRQWQELAALGSALT